MDIFSMTPKVINQMLLETAVTYAYLNASLSIRSADAADVAPVLAMHQRLSDASLYQRYLTPRQPTHSEISAICTLDGDNGRVLVASTPGKHPKVIGIAFFIVSGPDSAEVAFLVEDRFQGLGIGKELVRQLTRQAIGQGIQVFEATLLPSNLAALHLLSGCGQLVANRLRYGCREIRVKIS